MVNRNDDLHRTRQFDRKLPGFKCYLMRQCMQNSAKAFDLTRVQNENKIIEFYKRSLIELDDLEMVGHRENNNLQVVTLREESGSQL